MVALLYMFRSALNIYSSKEYIYIMDDALSFIYFYLFLGTMDVISLFNLYVYMCLEYICLEVHWIYSLKEYIYVMDLWMYYLCYGWFIFI